MNLLVMTLAPMLISCVSNETFYIVTSSKSHCPQEFIGQPCLTLEQYASHHRQGSSNVILTTESGNHFLQSSPLRFGQYSNRMNSFIMNTEQPETKIIYTTSPREIEYISGNIILFYANYVRINGITFIGGFVHIEINDAQEVIINNCSFQGVSISLFDMNNAIFSRCTFSDYRHYRYHSTDGVIITVFPNGALSIYDPITTIKIVQSNFTNNEEALFVYVYNYYDYFDHTLSLHVHIQECIFSNNTSEFNGGAVYLTGYGDDNRASISVNRSLFFNNTASRSDGAIYVDVEHMNFSVTETSFIQNSADSCGVLNILHSNTRIAQITGTIFDSNKANTGGGALCITNTSAVISNCTFTGNTVTSLGGAVVSHDSMVVINRTIFHNNMAGGDGGALVSYAHPSNYTISQSTFMHNQAGDDGGAIFIGYKGSYVTLDMCAFIDNNATDRGGAITIFGSTMEITETSIVNNRAALGETFSSCNSNVTTTIYGHIDINCSHDGPIGSIDHFNATASCKAQNFTNITLGVSIGDFCVEYRPPEPTIKNVNKVAMTAYASLSISAIVVIAFLLYLLVEKLARSKIKWSTGTVFTRSTQSQSEPLYAEATVQVSSDSVEMIEMKPNVLYGKCEPQSQACSQPQETIQS